MLKYHKKSCHTCKHYRSDRKYHDCLILGRVLSTEDVDVMQYCRYCHLWEEKPNNQEIKIQAS